MIDKIEKIIREKLVEDKWHIDHRCYTAPIQDEGLMETSISRLIKAIKRVLRYAPPT